MFSIEIECTPEGKDLAVADLWEAGAAGVIELSDVWLRAFFEDTESTGALERFGALSWRHEEERDWVAESRADWPPMLVGERFFLVPEWLSDPAPEGRFRIAVNPGMAFGTGRHETTRLCLEALETYIAAGKPVLDVGTGSGILARAAVLLGADPVWACDTDPDAVEIARVTAGPLIFLGSAEAVRSGSAHLVVANISPEAIRMLAADLRRCLGANGVALLSGFSSDDIPAVHAQWESLGGKIIETRAMGEWALIAAHG